MAGDENVARPRREVPPRAGGEQFGIAGLGGGSVAGPGGRLGQEGPSEALSHPRGDVAEGRVRAVARDDEPAGPARLIRGA